MTTTENHLFHINVSIAGETASIYLVGHFSFKSHIDFKSAYKNQLANSSITQIIVNLAEVNYVDSSALGMLLMLRDQAQSMNKMLTLVQPSEIAKRSFDIANFDKLFTITA